MKELSIEQKAKAYDKAIEKIKYVMEHGVSPTLSKEDLQDIFSELRESEDEKIRKAIIRLVEINKESMINNVTSDSMLSWLEKRKDYVSPQMVADAYLRGCNDTEKKWLEKQAPKPMA